MKLIKIGYDPLGKKDILKARFEPDELPKVQLFNSADVIYGNPSSNIAIAFIYTWKTDSAPDYIRETFIKVSNYAALTGFWRTTNGTKYVFANILANPNINKLLVFVFGQRDNGHLLVEALENYWRYGTRADGVIINSKAPNPKFEQLSMEALERVRKQCDLVIKRNLTNDAAKILPIVSAMIQEPTNAALPSELGVEFISSVHQNIFDDGCRFEKPMQVDLLGGAKNVTFEERELLPAIGQGIQARNLSEALNQAASFVFRNGTMFRDQRNVLNVECRSLSITVIDALDGQPDGFSREYVEKYADEFMNGAESTSEFTYTYHERIFRKWGNQVEKVISLLKKHPNTRRATISLWDSSSDVENPSSPCLDFLWFVARDNQMELHAVYRSHHLATVTRDGKVLAGEGAFVPNVYALATLHKKVAEEVGMKRGAIVINDLSGHLYVSEV